MDSAQLAMPAGKPPPGVIPNPINPYSNGPTLIAVGSVLVALMLVCVSVRVYAKFKIVGKLTPDDCKYKELFLDSRDSDTKVDRHLLFSCGNAHLSPSLGPNCIRLIFKMRRPLDWCNPILHYSYLRFVRRNLPKARTLIYCYSGHRRPFWKAYMGSHIG